MLNQTTMLQRVGVPRIVDGFMVASRTDAIGGIPSTQGIEITPDLSCKLSGPTSNFTIIPSTTGREIQADNTKERVLSGDPPPKPSTKPSSDRKNKSPKQPNTTPNQTHNRELHRLPHAG